MLHGPLFPGYFIALFKHGLCFTELRVLPLVNIVVLIDCSALTNQVDYCCNSIIVMCITLQKIVKQQKHPDAETQFKMFY